MLYSGTYMAAVGVKGLTLFGDRAQGRAGYTQHYRPVCCSIVRGWYSESHLVCQH